MVRCPGFQTAEAIALSPIPESWEGSSRESCPHRGADASSGRAPTGPAVCGMSIHDWVVGVSNVGVVFPALPDDFPDQRAVFLEAETWTGHQCRGASESLLVPVGERLWLLGAEAG